MNKVDKNKRHEEKRNPYDNGACMRLVFTGLDGKPDVRDICYKELVNIRDTLMACNRSFDSLCQTLFRIGDRFRRRVRQLPPRYQTKQPIRSRIYTGDPMVQVPGNRDDFIVGYKSYRDAPETQEEYNEQLADIFIARGLSAFLWMI